MNISVLTKSVVLVATVASLGTGCVVRREVHYRPYQPPPQQVMVQSVPVPPPNAPVQYAPAPAPIQAPPPVSEVVVPQAPPAPIVETVTVAPDPNYVWVGGVWVWRDRWVWSPGHWDRPPHPGAIWIGPRYEHRRGRYVVVHGYWR